MIARPDVMVTGRRFPERWRAVVCVVALLNLATPWEAPAQERFANDQGVETLSATEPVGLSGGGWLAVDSAPAGIPVTLDGEPLGTTPLLVPRRAGEYALVLGESDPIRVVIESAAVTRLAVSLDPSYVVVAVQGALLLWDAPQVRDSQVTTIPPGGFGLSREPGTLRLLPVYPRQTALDRSSATTIAAMVATVVVGSIEVAGVVETPSRLPLLAGGGMALSALTMGRTAVLERHRREYYRNFRPPEPARYVEAADIAARAGVAGEQGRRREQEALLQELVERHPRAPEMTAALYQLGRLSVLSGDVEQAEDYLVQVVVEHPRVELVDEAGLLLLDLLLARGQDERAREVLRRLPRLRATAIAQELDFLVEELLGEAN